MNVYKIKGWRKRHGEMPTYFTVTIESDDDNEVVAKKFEAGEYARLVDETIQRQEMFYGVDRMWTLKKRPTVVVDEELGHAVF